MTNKELTQYLREALKKLAARKPDYKHYDKYVRILQLQLVDAEEHHAMETKLRKAAESELAKVPQPAPQEESQVISQLTAVLGHLSDLSKMPTSKLVDIIHSAQQVIDSRHAFGERRSSSDSGSSGSPTRPGLGNNAFGERRNSSSSGGNNATLVDSAVEASVAAGQSGFIISSPNSKYRGMGGLPTFKATTMECCNVCWDNGSDGVCGACNKAMCEDCYTKCTNCPYCRTGEGSIVQKKAGFVKLAHTTSYYC